jgi:hypothetical protein
VKTALESCPRSVSLRPESGLVACGEAGPLGRSQVSWEMCLQTGVYRMLVNGGDSGGSTGEEGAPRLWQVEAKPFWAYRPVMGGN